MLSSKTNARAWLYANHCFINRTDSRKITHLLLDGGKVHVPKQLMPQFNAACAKDIDTNCHNFISENGTNIFKLFFDLDIHDTAPVEGDQLKRITDCIRGTVRDFAPEGCDLTHVVCETTCKEKTVNNIIYIKTGVHLIFPCVYVCLLYTSPSPRDRG